MSGSDTKIIRLGGELDVQTAPEITRQAEDALAAGARELVFDLGDVVFIDSTAIGALIKARESAAAVEGSVRLVNVSANTHRLLSLTALDTIFAIEDAPADDADDDHDD